MTLTNTDFIELHAFSMGAHRRLHCADNSAYSDGARRGHHIPGIERSARILGADEGAQQDRIVRFRRRPSECFSIGPD